MSVQQTRLIQILRVQVQPYSSPIGLRVTIGLIYKNHSGIRHHLSESWDEHNSFLKGLGYLEDEK